MMPEESGPEVVLVDIKIPFWRLMIFTLKWSLAAIPAFLLVYGIPLALISVPQYYAYKQQAADAKMKSVLHNAATSMEAYYGQAGNTYKGATVGSLALVGFKPEPGISLEIVQATESRYLLRAVASGGTHPSWVFDSDTGKISPGTQ